MSVRARSLCHWLEKFMCGHKKTPAQDFFGNESPSSLTGEMSQAALNSFSKISLMTSYNYYDHFPPSIVLITLPMSRS